MRKNLELLQLQNDARQKALDQELKLIALEEQRLETQSDLLDSMMRMEFATAQAGRESGIVAKNLKSLILKHFQSSFSRTTTSRKQRKLIELNYQNELAIEEKRAQARLERVEEIDAIKRRDKILEKQASNEIDNFNRLTNVQDKQTAIFEARNKIELQKFDDERANIEAQKTIAAQNSVIANLQLMPKKKSLSDRI